MTIETLVQQIHETPTRAVLIVTGGGTGIFPTLLAGGGGSATLISGIIPYGTQETIDILGGEPDKLCSEEVTRKLAMVAFLRALKHRPPTAEGEPTDPVIGVASSSILQRIPIEREGRIHYIYAALQTHSQTISLTLTIEPHTKRFRSHFPSFVRATEEHINVVVLLNLLSEGCDLPDRVHMQGLPEITKRRISTFDSLLISRLVCGQLRALAFDCYQDGRIVPKSDATDASPKQLTLFPGSFNPYHAGHEEMCGVAVDLVNRDVLFEISLQNVGKPNLDLISLEERLQQFCKHVGGHGPIRVWVTNAPTFVEKVKLFPGATFIIGYDTAVRICDPQYAGSIWNVIDTFEQYGVRFIVFNRNAPRNHEQFPSRFQRLSTFVNQPMEHSHVSSSAIRKGEPNLLRIK